MKIYIQCREDGFPYSKNAFDAMLGFEQMGFEICFFKDHTELYNIDEDILVMGGIGRVKAYLEHKGITVNDIDYPSSLIKYLGRNVTETTTKNLLKEDINFPVFIKPKEGKMFTGKLCKSTSDFAGLFTADDDIEIYVSDPVNIVEEFRCFIRYGEVLDVRRYYGELGHTYDLNLIKEMVDAYTDSPCAYSLDIAVTDKGETVLVEINDGYSLGDYGLDPLLYAKLISARWAEMTNIEDECDFTGMKDIYLKRKNRR